MSAITPSRDIRSVSHPSVYIAPLMHTVDTVEHCVLSDPTNPLYSTMLDRVLRLIGDETSRKRLLKRSRHSASMYAFQFYSSCCLFIEPNGFYVSTYLVCGKMDAFACARATLVWKRTSKPSTGMCRSLLSPS